MIRKDANGLIIGDGDNVFIKNLKRFRKLFIKNKGWHQKEIHQIRKNEFDNSYKKEFFFNKDILEIGGSDGYLASIISRLKPSSLISIDINPIKSEFYHVLEYDAANIPVKESSIDIIFSSNTFEHIKDIDQFLSICKTILRTNGEITLMLPSHIWRLFSCFNCFLFLLPPSPHGIHSNNVISEYFNFMPRYWINLFKKNGFICKEVKGCGYFYAEPKLFPINKKTLPIRKFLSNILGNSSYVYSFIKESE